MRGLTDDERRILALSVGDPQDGDYVLQPGDVAAVENLVEQGRVREESCLDPSCQYFGDPYHTNFIATVDGRLALALDTAARALTE